MYLVIQDDEDGAAKPSMFRQCGSKSFYFTEEQHYLIDRVAQNSWASKKDRTYAALAGNLKYIDYQSIVASTIYYYDQGLTQKEIRKEICKDYGFSILIALQLVLVIIQIIYWIRELRKKDSVSHS